MAKVKPAAVEEKEDGAVSPEQQAMSLLKANKADHFNFEDSVIGRTRASSLTLTAFINGGIEPGCHRACGISTGGKTSCTLDFMFNFLNEKDKVEHRGVYVKAEGRLSQEMMERSGVKFTNDPKEWKDGTCLIVESNVIEFVYGFMGDLIRNNVNKVRYFFILDSMDMLAKRADLAKGFDDAQQVAGGAVVTSVFLKQASAALSKRGHICWFISQVRETIRIQNGPPGPPRQGGASGGHAVEHAGDYVLEFLPRWQDDIIRENPNDKNSTPIGHYCRVKVVKSNNEKYGETIRYPIKYGRTGGKSVWIEREIGDLLLPFGYLEKKGAWYNFSAEQAKEIAENVKGEIPEKIQGMDNVYEMLNNNPELMSYYYNKILKFGSVQVTQ